MPETLTTTQAGHGSLPPIDEDPFRWDGDGDGNGPNERGASRKTSLIGLVVMMCASVMTFAALASALVVRRGMGNDWSKMPLPWILWPNTAALLVSSVVLDVARRLLNHGKRMAFNWVWSAGTLLGSCFLAGQIIAWRELNARGYFVAANPSNGFFYIMTWTHAAHAIGGLIALIWVAVMALRFRFGPSRRTFMLVSLVFWHFLDVLWVLLMLLFVYYG
ncbi:MAG: cytochrome c oxidase, subunit [Bryobacterales bacterium]|nr:cytochrome c oxidase, subunit [Bryobacterales bacterium]